jgi:DNA-binding transcriptional ArsR family regulator
MHETTSVEIFKCLGDQTRLSLVRNLLRENRELAGSALLTSCSEILQLSQPTLSHHFSRLVHSGIFLERKAGTEKYYQINYTALLAAGIEPTKL